jgi:hypothetical protein
MARARNIKPGFFTNEDLVELDFATRLLFAGLWTVADREGRLQDRPKKIKIDVFPADNLDIDAMLQQLHNAKFIQRYEVDGEKFIQISSWDKHQNPHHTEKASEIPGPNGELTVKAPLKPKESQSSDGGNLADSLIPDSLIPDSEKRASAAAPATPPTPDKPKNRSITLAAYLDTCKALGTKAIPDDHHIRRYCADAGITDEMTAIAWLRFREEHTTGARKAKRYIDWPETFANCVKSSWYGLWVCNAEGPANWTSKGLQEKRVADARRAEKEAAHAPAGPP